MTPFRSRESALPSLVPALACLLLAQTSAAVVIEWEALSDQGPANAISLENGGITATAEAFGGITEPQDTITPDTIPGEAGTTQIQVNIDGAFPNSNVFGLRGLGCGIAQCDLIAPGGEDAVRISFDVRVRLDQLILSAMEGPDDITWWYWEDGAWVFAGQDDCSGVSCSGQETFNGPFGSSEHWLVVAENSGASAFRIAQMSVAADPLPEPPAPVPALGLLGSTALAGLLALGGRARLRHTGR